jgi:hypothetical protein
MKNVTKYHLCLCMCVHIYIHVYIYIICAHTPHTHKYAGTVCGGALEGRYQFSENGYKLPWLLLRPGLPPSLSLLPSLSLSLRVYICMHVCICAGVCVREREYLDVYTQGTERETHTHHTHTHTHTYTHTDTATCYSQLYDTTDYTTPHHQLLTASGGHDVFFSTATNGFCTVLTLLHCNRWLQCTCATTTPSSSREAIFWR